MSNEDKDKHPNRKSSLRRSKTKPVRSPITGRFKPVARRSINMSMVRELQAQGLTRAEICLEIGTSKNNLGRAIGAYNANESGIEEFRSHKEAVRESIEANGLCLAQRSGEVTMDAIDRHEAALALRDKGESYNKDDIFKTKDLGSFVKACSSAYKDYNTVARLESGQSTSNQVIINTSPYEKAEKLHLQELGEKGDDVA